MIGVLSKGIARLPSLETFLGEQWCLVNRQSHETITHVAGWGLKPTADKARAYAAKHRLPYLSLEDGFLRSVGLGADEAPLSLVIDDLGIYYDATRPSGLERLISTSLFPVQEKRATKLVDAWCNAEVSKYNHARSFDGSIDTPYVLVVDQTLGDASLQYGMATKESFAHMLDTALRENPQAEIWLKVHPEVMAGRKQGHFNLVDVRHNARIRVLAEDVHPVRLIANAQAIYTVTSQMGFEGLLWGRKVRTFGMPFYAGWGLTTDELAAPRRRTSVSLAQLVHAALIAYSRYIDPETGVRCEVERVLEYLGLQRRMMARFPAQLYATGFSEWKKPIVRAFVQGSKVAFHARADMVPPNAEVLLWGRKALDGILPETARAVRLEDGFIRSVGLGADLTRPLSWVMDRSGIYYDVTAPSDLETILQNSSFDPALLARAEMLRERLVALAITKYNVGNAKWQRPEMRAEAATVTPARKVILVPGQVESDASLTYGSPQMRSNLDLLKAVRVAHPDAYVLYKPHPDVVAGLREAGEKEDGVAAWCDEIVVDVSMGALLLEIDEVHTMTSLAGFEALMRGKHVVCYGQPFYAGWGLTQDLAPVARRTRRLEFGELVAGSLILYPVYVSRTTGRFTTPERALDELVAWRDIAPHKISFWRKIFRIFLAWEKR